MVNEYCGRTSAHVKHRWYMHWWNKTRFCPGIEPPTIEPLDRDKIYRNHKHRFWLTRRSWNQRNQHGSLSTETKLGFTCKDGCVRPDGSPYIIEMQRWEYNEMVLKPKPVYQTWPG